METELPIQVEMLLRLAESLNAEDTALLCDELAVQWKNKRTSLTYEKRAELTQCMVNRYEDAPVVDNDGQIKKE